jgi:hypothetical protein
MLRACSKVIYQKRYARRRIRPVNLYACAIRRRCFFMVVVIRAGYKEVPLSHWMSQLSFRMEQYDFIAKIVDMPTKQHQGV